MVRVREVIHELVSMAERPFSSGAYGDEGLFELCLLEALSASSETGAVSDGLEALLLALWGDNPDVEAVPSQAVSALVDRAREMLAFYVPMRFRFSAGEDAAILREVQDTFRRAPDQVEPQAAGRILDSIQDSIRTKGLWNIARGGEEWICLRGLDLLWVVAPYLREGPVREADSRGAVDPQRAARA